MENQNGLQTNLSAEVGTTITTINNLVDGFFATLPKLAIAVVVFILVLIVAKIVKSVVERIVGTQAPMSVAIALGRIANIAVTFVGLLIAVAIVAPSVGAAELLQILGVGSVAIGFAFRDILQNFLAGLIILLRRPFSVGDWIRFSGYEGRVSEISTRSTWLHTFSGEDVSIPNGELFTNPFTIMTKEPLIRTDYDFGVSYDANLDDALETVLNAIQSVSELSKEKSPDVGITDLGDSSITIRGRWWTHTDDVYSAKINVLKTVKQALDTAGIDIPYPHMQLKFPENAFAEK